MVVAILYIPGTNTYGDDIDGWAHFYPIGTSYMLEDIHGMRTAPGS